MNTTTVEVSTKASKEAEAITTNLTINWDGMTPEEIRELAQQALVVKLQGNWRKNTIPSGDFEVKAADHKVGTRAPRGPIDPIKLLGMLTPEQREELRKQLMGE